LKSQVIWKILHFTFSISQCIAP